MNCGPIHTAVIPAAGRGTRFLPATKVVPKSLLPIAGKPLIQYAVEEAAASGIQKVILVLAPEMALVSEHFRINGASNGDRRLRALAESVEIRAVMQQYPKGLADAVACAEQETGDESFAVILPDVLIDSAVPATQQLVRCYKAHPGCVIGTQLVPRQEVDKFGILVPASSHSNHELAFRVASLLEKPKQASAPSRYGVIGRYLLTREIFSCIRELEPGCNNELQLSDALSLCAERSSAYGCVVDGTHYDAGDKLGHIRASLAYALKDPVLERPLRRHLAQLSTPALMPTRAS